MQSIMRLYCLLLLIGLSLLLAACSGGSGTTSPTAQTNVPRLEGIAAAGAPLTGTVYVTDSSYPPQKTSAAINQDGTFSVAVDDLTPPLLLKAVGTAAGTPLTLYSFATAPGNVQVNPLTDLLVAGASGTQNRTDLFALYSSHNRASLQSVANRLPRMTADLQGVLQPLLALYGAVTLNPFTAVYQINHQGLDGLFDDTAIEITNGTVTVTNRASGAVIYSAALDNLANGTMTTASLPTPATYAKPGNARLTLHLDGLPAGTLIKRLKTTIRLPLGVTVEQGTAAVNTAIPSGSATGAVVYPLPSLSATNNELTLELSSLNGFAAGEFLTLRCVVSFSDLTTVSVADFKVLKSELYSDIYKREKLSGGTVSATLLMFPVNEGKTVYDKLCSVCHTLDANDAVGRPSLLSKAALIPDKFGSGHRGIRLILQQVEDLQAFLGDQSK